MVSFSRYSATLALAALCTWPVAGQTSQQAQGFALERFYPSAPGGGWFVMDDLNISGGLGGAVSLGAGYSRNPLVISGSSGSQRVALVSAESFVDIGVAATYDRYRLYLNFPI